VASFILGHSASTNDTAKNVIILDHNKQTSKAATTHPDHCTQQLTKETRVTKVATGQT